MLFGVLVFHHYHLFDDVNGLYLLDNLMIKLRLPVVLYVSFAVGS